uniref:hypothetical protein n=1 Tax=Aequorivita sinensis TaxID=1382458 RepID=UPI002491934B
LVWDGFLEIDFSNFHFGTSYIFLKIILLAITQLSTQQALKIAFQRNFIKFMKYRNINPATEIKRKLV